MIIRDNRVFITLNILNTSILSDFFFFLKSFEGFSKDIASL